MKTTTRLMWCLTCLMGTGIAQAREVAGNPDRYPSLEVHGAMTSLSGTREDVDTTPASLVRVNEGSETWDRSSVGLGVRVPVTDSLTLEGGYTYHDGESRFSSPTTLHHESENLHGQTVNVGVRFYLK